MAFKLSTPCASPRDTPFPGASSYDSQSDTRIPGQRLLAVQGSSKGPLAFQSWWDGLRTLREVTLRCLPLPPPLLRKTSRKWSPLNLEHWNIYPHLWHWLKVIHQTWPITLRLGRSQDRCPWQQRRSPYTLNTPALYHLLFLHKCSSKSSLN